MRESHLMHILQKIVKIGAALEKPVVVLGAVHYLDQHDAIYRCILIHSLRGANPLNRHSLPAVHFRSTREMLEAFSWLGAECAQKLVVTNSNLIAD